LKYGFNVNRAYRDGLRVGCRTSMDESIRNRQLSYPGSIPIPSKPYSSTVPSPVPPPVLNVPPPLVWYSGKGCRRSLLQEHWLLISWN